MDIRYMVSRPGGDRTGAIGLSSARRKVRAQAKKYGESKGRRLRLKERADDDWGIFRKDVGETMSKWEALVRTAKPGDVVLMDIEDFPYTISTRIIDVTPPTVQTDGNADVDKIFTWLVRNEKGRNGGICNRRDIAGTGTWSQHSPWPAPDPGSNAIDWFAYPDTMAELYEQGAALAQAAKADPQNVPVGLILVGSKAWSPEVGWHFSSAEYHRHLHVQGRKTRTGTPRASCP